MSSEFGDIQSCLDNYKDQLRQVEEALEATPDDESLQSLSASLRELISLTEASDHQQEALCHEDTPAPPNHDTESNEKTCTDSASGLDAEMALFQAEMSELGAISNDAAVTSNESPTPSVGRQNMEDLQESLMCLVGRNCTAPYTHSWGQMQIHSAVIESVEIPDSPPHADSSDICTDHVMVRVLFSHPTHVSMMPCRYFLRQQCQYTDAECRFSHGHTVPLSQIGEAPCDSSVAVSAGCDVLIRRHDNEDLWRRVRVLQFDAESGRVTIESGSADAHQVSLQEVAVVPNSAERMDDSPVEDLCDVEADATSYHLVTEEDFTPVSVWQNISCSDRLAGWEEHTTGIGSKLLRQMGYVTGCGLGVNGEGRVEPVQATVYPVGKSLDHCMQLRQGLQPCKPALLTVEKLAERHKHKQLRSEQRREKQKQKANAVFDVINRLTDSNSANDSHERITAAFLRSSSNSELNMRHFRVGEQISEVQRQVRHLAATSERNVGASGDRARQQLSNQRQLLSSLQADDRRLTDEKQARASSKRLDVF